MEIPDTTKIVVNSHPAREDEVLFVPPTMFEIDGNKQDITATMTSGATIAIPCRDESATRYKNSGTDMLTVSTNTTSSAQCAAVDKTNFIPLAPPVMVMVDE